MEGSHKRALIVDDEPIVRDVITETLTEGGWEVSSVDSAEAALPFLDQDFPLFIVDKNLPGKSGIHFICELRKRDQNAGIVLITGYGTVESAVESLHLGIDAYIEKPFPSIFNLARLIEDVDRRRCRRQNGGRMLHAVGHFSRASACRKGVAANAGSEQAIDCWVVGTPIAEQDLIRKWLEGIPGETRCFRTSESARLQLAHDNCPDLAIVPLELGPQVEALILGITEYKHGASAAVIANQPNLAQVTRLIQLGAGALLERPLDERQFACKIQPLIERLRWRL